MVMINGKKFKKKEGQKLATFLRLMKRKKKRAQKKVEKENSLRAQVAIRIPTLTPVPAPLATPEKASSSAPSISGTSLQVKEKDIKASKHPNGFIFMCNGKTKDQCFQFRVFGLPIGKKELVEMIKPGTKLFLFDVESKLLYGIYEATSEGKLNLEPTAFGGRFPAQVKFKILNSCLPLPEQSFRNAVIDNYLGNKFSPELNKGHVKKLMTLFRPLDASLSTASTVPIPSAAVPTARHPSRREERHPSRREERYNPPAVYLSGMRLPPPQRMMEQPPVQRLPIVQHHQHAAPALLYHPHSAVDRSFSIPTERNFNIHCQPSRQEVQIVQHQELAPAASMEHASREPTIHSHFGPYHHAHSHPTYSSGSHALIVHEPGTRNHVLQEGYPHASRFGSDYHRLLLQRESESALLRESGTRYNSQSSLLEERETALNGEIANTYYSLPTAPYIPSTTQTHALAYERPEENIPDPQVPLTQERETTHSSHVVGTYYRPPTIPYVPSTVSDSYLVSEPYIPSSDAAHHMPPVEPYVPSSVPPFQTDLSLLYSSSSIRPYMLTSERPELNIPPSSYHAISAPRWITR